METQGKEVVDEWQAVEKEKSTEGRDPSGLKLIHSPILHLFPTLFHRRQKMQEGSRKEGDDSMASGFLLLMELLCWILLFW
jgi:hypothetical protein